MNRRLLTALTAVPLIAGCGADATAPASDSPDDAPTGDHVSDGLPHPFDENDVLRVTLGDGEIRFQATCNTMSGLASWKDGVLRVSQVGGTEMGCPGAGHEQDEWLIDFFTSSPKVTVDGTDVRLASDDIEIWLIPADEVATDPGPDAELEGTRWELTGVEETDQDSVGMLVVERRFDANLQIDGNEFTFHTGCNGGGGGVNILGDRLDLRGVGITLRGCGGVPGELESAQVPVLMADEVAWTIAGQELRLTRGNTTLVYRAR